MVLVDSVDCRACRDCIVPYVPTGHLVIAIAIDLVNSDVVPRLRAEGLIDDGHPPISMVLFHVLNHCLVAMGRKGCIS